MAVSILQVLFTSGSCVCIRLYNSWRSGLKLVFVRGGACLPWGLQLGIQNTLACSDSKVHDELLFHGSFPVLHQTPTPFKLYLRGSLSLISQSFSVAAVLQELWWAQITTSWGEQLPKEGLAISFHYIPFSSLLLCAQQMIISQKHSGFFFFLCSSNYPFLSALPCVCLHWTSSDFVLPIHWALLNVIEIEFGLGVEAWGWCSRKALLPRRKKYCEILQLLSPVKSSCVHVTVN